MKVKLNAIGFTNVKYILISEGLIVLGITLSIIGLITLRKSQEWVIGNTEKQLKYFKEIYNIFKV